MARRFNSEQRIALYLAADGKCCDCGFTLGEDWHADHVVPFSRGGETDVKNGQALCAACNLRKGNRMEGLRKWQGRALVSFDRREGKNFLLEATPGAGKTVFAAAVCMRLLNDAAVGRLIIVVPTEALKYQWAEVFAEHGLDIEPDWSNGTAVFPADMIGLVVTYQQLQSKPDLFARHVDKVTTLAIFDEIHHCNREGMWGSALRTAFDRPNCICRLGLSGTPFRSDNNEIPFVRYVEGQGCPDFRYGYGDALKDRICRHMIFERQGGTLEWVTPLGDHRRKTFDDPCKEEELNHRLRTAVSPKGKWVEDTIVEADALLTELRKTDSDAAGLYVCADQASATDVRDYMRTIGIHPIVVMSDEKNSSTLIKQFRKSSDRWILAIKMVSEGVDIPRLRVGVYAAICTTPMFFRQLIGRFVRREKGHDDHTAHVFIPDDERLRAMAAEIREQVTHSLLEEYDEPKTREPGEFDSDGLFFQPLSSTAEGKGAIYNQENYSPEEIAEATRRLEAIGESGTMRPVKMAAVIRMIKCDSNPALPVDVQVETLSNRKKDVRATLFTLSKAIANRHRLEHREVQGKLNRSVRVAKRDQATKEQLELMLTKAQAWLKDGELRV